VNWAHLLGGASTERAWEFLTKEGEAQTYRAHSVRRDPSGLGTEETNRGIEETNRGIEETNRGIEETNRGD